MSKWAAVGAVAAFVAGVAAFFVFATLTSDSQGGPIDGDAENVDDFLMAFPDGCTPLRNSEIVECSGDDLGIASLPGLVWYQWQGDGINEDVLTIGGQQECMLVSGRTVASYLPRNYHTVDYATFLAEVPPTFKGSVKTTEGCRDGK